MTTKDKIKTAEAIVAAGFDGNVWCPAPEKENAPVRIYAANRNGYIVIKDNGDANIDAVKRSRFDAAKDACATANINAVRY